MTSDFPLDWATLAVSIFNTILLLWLGLTVLLNSERRSPGVWVAGSGLLMSGLFFLSHTALLGIGLLAPGSGTNLWWRTGWIPVVCMPFAWYMVMLWYSSYWDDSHSTVHQRHQLPLVLVSLLAISTVGLVFLFNAVPSYNRLVNLDLAGILSIGGVPVLLVVYPLYLVMCIGFSLDVLLHPGTPVRLMGQQARQRARPWLILATASLLLVSLLVGAFLLWGFYLTNRPISQGQFAFIISIFDLVIDLLIAMTIIAIGQAIISYEVFTGKVLPRQGLKRYWRWAIILSLAIAGVVAWALVDKLEPIYVLLSSIVLVTSTYAILGWRSFNEQERYLQLLHPLLTNQRLYDQLLLRDPSDLETNLNQSFQALCHDLLGVRRAFLIPLGIFGPLVGEALTYPPGNEPGSQETIQRELQHSTGMTFAYLPAFLPVSDCFGRNAMAITLWSERGLTGVLVVGEKQDASLFTQEEIEIARTIGERLIDSQASAKLAARLMQLERQHLAENAVIDQQARRTLHDDILPRLQSQMIKISTGQHSTDEVVHELGDIHRQLAALMRKLPALQQPELAQKGLVEALQVTLETEYRPYFGQVNWSVDEQAAEKSRSLPPFAANVLYHAAREAIRNAAHHGRHNESDPLVNLWMIMTGHGGVEIKIQDDGIGFDVSAYNAGNGGQGLAIHSTLMAVIGGSLAVERIAGQRTVVTLRYPA